MAKDCYGCLGTGYLVGFGSKPKTPCPCSTCSECGDHTSDFDEDFVEYPEEGKQYCVGCHVECDYCEEIQLFCDCVYCEEHHVAHSAQVTCKTCAYEAWCDDEGDRRREERCE